MIIVISISLLEAETYDGVTFLKLLYTNFGEKFMEFFTLHLCFLCLVCNFRDKLFVCANSKLL